MSEYINEYESSPPLPPDLPPDFCDPGVRDTTLDEYFPLFKRKPYSANSGGKTFFYQSLPGTPWFDGVDSHKGWVFGLSLGINDVGNDFVGFVEDIP